MKKSMLAALALGCALALALVGCSSGGASSAASSSASEEASSSAEASSQASVANPWSDVADIAAAIAGAGIDGFNIPEGLEIGLGKVDFSSFRCMDGLVEAVCDFPAVQMTLRKGLGSVAENGDISGDYNEYKNTWTQDIDGVEVTCSGNREGEATKTVWTDGDDCYSINVLGLGGDDDYGLPADDLAALVSAIMKAA